MASRIVAIANRFDNLTNPIDPRFALSPSECLSHMWTKEQPLFDPKLLQLFIRAMGVYPPGTVVKLSNGMIGAVLSSAPTEKPLLPKVLIYEPTVPRREAIIIDLVKEPSEKIDHALRLQGLDPNMLDYLLPRRKMSWFRDCG